MKIVIVGAGGIGLLLGFYLSKGGHEVVFVEKKDDSVAAINSRGIEFMATEADGHADVSFSPAKAFKDVDAKQIDKCDAIFLAVKSFDTAQAVMSVAHLITENSPILCLQTGIGNFEKIEKIERRNNILGGLTYMAGAALGPAKVRQGGVGKTYFGEIAGGTSERGERLCRVFNGCGLEAEFVDDIKKRLWCKVLVFSAINPISGVLRIKNGHLLDKMESISLAKRLIDEGIEVAEAVGVSLQEYDLYELLFETCRHSSDNISSMLMDLIMGRRTEIDALNGEIARLGDELGVVAGTHRTMTELVRLGEKWGAGFQQQV